MRAEWKHHSWTPLPHAAQVSDTPDTMSHLFFFFFEGLCRDWLHCSFKPTTNQKLSGLVSGKQAGTIKLVVVRAVYGNVFNGN